MRFVRFLVVILAFVSAPAWSNAQVYKVDSSGALLRSVCSTLDAIKDAKNKKVYIDAVAIIAAHNFEMSGEDFYKVFDGKRPRDILTLAKNLNFIISGRIRGNDINKKASAQRALAYSKECSKCFESMFEAQRLNKSLEALSASGAKLVFTDVKPSAEFVVKNGFSKQIKSVTMNFRCVNEADGKVIASEEMPVGLGSILKAGEERKVEVGFSYDSKFCKIKPSDKVRLEIDAMSVVFKKGKPIRRQEIPNPFNFSGFEGLEM